MSAQPLYVNTGSAKGKKVFQEPSQIIEARGARNEMIDTYTALTITGASPSTANAQTTIVIPKSGGRVKSVVLWVDLTVASAATHVAPMPLWFNRMDLYLDKGSTQWATYYGKCLYQMMNLLDPQTIKAIGSLMNMTPEGHPYKEVPVSTRRFCMPLLGFALEGCVLDFQPSDMHFTVNWNSITENGTATNCTLSNMGLYIETYKLDAQERAIAAEMYSNGFYQKNFFEITQNLDPGLTIVGGTNTERTLSSITGKYGALYLSLQQNTGNANKRERQYDAIGHPNARGTIDLTQADGSPIIGNTPRDIQLIEYDMSKHQPGIMHKNGYHFYTISFTDPKDIIQGKFSGYQQFNGTQRLHINGGTATSETARVITFLYASDADFGSATAADNGEYGFVYHRGDGTTWQTTNFPYNETNANMDAEFDEVFQRLPWLAADTARGADDATGVQLSISGLTAEYDLEVNGGRWEPIVNLEDGATGMICDVVQTTAGTPISGLPSATRNITVYGLKLKKARLNSNLGLCAIVDA